MEVLAPAYFSNSSWILGEKKSGNWTQQENKLFENALAHFDRDTPDRWVRVAGMIPGKTVEDVMSHYHDLEEDVSYIEAGLIPFPGYSSSSFTLDWESGHSFDDINQPYSICVKRPGNRFVDHERKKGVPWTEEEHKRFLMGLKKYGKGDWRNISRNFVVTRTPTQVASHAQKYFIRLNSGSKDKRRASIHDITMVNIEDGKSPSPSQPSVVTMSSCSASTFENFSGVVDSKHPTEPASVFNVSTDNAQLVHPPYSIQPYELKLHGQSSIIGTHDVLF